ncbi:putative Ig domain-containing protein, partial [Streptosporangium carneum]
MTDGARRGTRPASGRGEAGPARPGRHAARRERTPRGGRTVARVLVLALSVSTLTGTSGTPTPASAAGTTVFDQTFRNNTADGTGSVVLPALPSGLGGSNTACLTASGNTSTGVLRSCSSTNDTTGSGKLRLTNATTNKLGGVFGATSVPTAQGLDVTFNTYQYGGNGADGIAFVLAAVDPTNPVSPANIGPTGGSLGYSAAGTSGFNGLAYGYLGVGLDVYGNFSNSSYQGTGCTNPAYISTSGTVPGQVVVRGPGQGLAGYCALNSTATSTSSSALSLRASTRRSVPVEVAINPSTVVITTPSGLSVPAKSYRVSVTPIGGTARTLQGSLPSVTSGLFPSSWLDASGVPKQLAFGWVASTGGSTDFHEIDNVAVTTLNAVPELSVAQTSYNATTPAAGDPVTYTVTAGVGSAVSETSPISVTETLPAGVVPVGAYGTGWVCAAPSGQSVTCTNGNTPFAAGSSLPPITVVGIVTGGSVTPTLIRTSSVATASASDANPGYSSSTTAGTLPSTPSGITLSSTTGSISGGNTVTVSGSNIGNATAIEIGTVAEQQAGTPVVLLPCATGVTTGCFTINGNGTLTIPSMPSRASNTAVRVTVVTQGLAAYAAYTYASSPAAPTAPTATAGVTGATVTWTAPSGNGSAITSYVVTPYKDGVAQTPITYDASATTRTLTGLTAGSSYTFTVTAVNAFGTGTASPASTAVVPYNVPGKPTITTVTAGDATATMTWTAPGNNGSAITGYVVTPYLNGVAQTPQTFSGTATTQTLTGLTPGATYTFTVAAQNAAGTGAASAPSASVVPNALPSLNLPAPPAGEVGAAYGVTLAVTGGTSPYTWSISGGTLPAGLTLNASTGVLSGTPTASGTYSFTVKVTDAVNQSATQAVTLTIAPPPSFSFSAPPAGEVGVAYGVTLAVTGGTAPYTWSVAAGTLPPGLTLNASTGVLSGTPTASGTYSFTAKVTDALNQTATRTVTVTVAAQPSFSFSAPPAAQVGVAYSVPLTVTGGTAPLTWSIPAGSLPPGLTLNASTGVLSGTPTTTGSHPFTVQVTDANGQTATRSVTLVVTAGPLVIVKTADVSAVAPGGTVNYTITVNNTGASAFTGVTLTDPLTGVLDDAVYNADATATSGTVSYTGPNLTWTGNVAAGATVTVTYSVKVANPDTGNKVLAGTVTSPTLGSTCPSGGADARCTATVTVSGLSIVKSAGVSTTTPGSTVPFTVTVTNNGQTAYTGATFADALAGVLDDATYNGDAVATAGSVSLSGSTLTWTGNLAVGATATVTYSVTVKDPDTGDRNLSGAVSSTTQGNTCPVGNPGAQCAAAVTVLIPALTITSSADAATTTPGSTVRYTVTAANTGQTAYTGTGFTLPLAGVLDDATYNGDAVATSGGVAVVDSTLTWTGNLAVGATATVAYSVTVKDPDPGDKVLNSSVTSTAAGNNCRAANPAPACSTSVPVLVPALTITKTADLSSVTPGATVRYTVTATNSGQTAYTGATFADALAGVLDDATYNGDATATTGGLSLSGSTLTWTGNLAVGATATVAYSVTVNDPDTGDRALTGAVTSATSGSTCPVGGTNTRCASDVLVLIPRLQITNATTVTTTTPGGVVPYTVTLTNTGQTDHNGVSASLNVAGAVDDASYNGDLTASAGSVSLGPNGTLVWTGNVAIGETVTVTGSVTVNNPDTGDKVLTTAVTSTAPGSTCPITGTGPGCSTSVTVLVPALTVVTTADRQTVTPGETVTYTVTASNTGQTPYTGATLTDQLALVLTDAVYNGDVTTTTGTVTLSGTNLTWTGDLAVGATATITFSVTVRDPDPGDKQMVNTAVSSAPGSTCPPGGADARCSTTVTVLVPALTVTKSADVSTTAPGSVVRYSVAVADSGQTPYTGATVTDALAGVLDDAVYNGDATATGGAVAFDGSNLTWTGDLAAGATATITYSVTVRDPDPGDALLTGAAVSTVRGSNCPAGGTDTRCSATVPVARLVLAQSYVDSTATPGSVVRLNATFTNTGQVPFTGISVFSPTAGTVDDAIPVGDQTASSGSLVLDANRITWTGSIPVGGVVTVTGTLTVKNPPTGDRVLTGTLISDAPGNSCPPNGDDPRCTARLTVVVPGLTITKAADTSVTTPGSTVGHTVTVTNSGQTPYTGATVTDALAGVLDDAVYNGDAAATVGAVALAGSNLTWTGDLPVGASAVITYSVTVRDPDPGDKSLVDSVTSTDTGSNCTPASGDPRCSTTVTVLTPALTIRKTAGSATAVPGAVVTYTVTAANTGQTAYTGATLTDALADVLDEATYNGDAVAGTGTVTLTGTNLTWTGDLAVGESVTVTYSVTVNNPVTGNLTLTGPVSSAVRGSTCPAGNTDPRCAVTVRVVEAATLTFGTSANVSSAARGQTVAYTVTVTNSGLTPYPGATFVDALAGVLDDATYNGDAAADVGTVNLTGTDLTWTGTVPA